MSADTLNEAIVVRKLDAIDEQQLRQLADVLIDRVGGACDTTFFYRTLGA